MKLSILICSVQKRLHKFAQLAEHLEKQAQNKPVEILWLGDNKTMTVGEKRNKLLSLSKGQYVCFVDDDDWVADDYVDELLKGTESGADVICFNALYRNLATGEEQPVRFDIGNLNVNEKHIRLRMPNHLCVVKREAAIAIGFLSANFGEDTNYGLRLRNERRLRTQYKIDKVLYYYDFDPNKSETAHLGPPEGRKMGCLQGHSSGRNGRATVLMDVIIVSNAEILPSEGGGAIMTQNCINSLLSPPSEGGEALNILVLEKAEHVKYTQADTFLQRSPFNYNQCLNNGALMGNAEFICFANNDVLFPQGFVMNTIKTMQGMELDVASVRNQFGTIRNDNISGFCFVMRREAYNKLGKFKEDYNFWCADNVVWEQIKEHNLRHAWLNIMVWHGVSTTLNKLDTETHSAYTKECVKQFNADYNRNLMGMGR
jgi:glycosyltransferase involved in cell wall biosynthesis